MMINRRRMMGETLPYDAEIEYLGSNSKQYIDTGIAGGKNTLTIECKFMYNNYINYGAIYGNYISDNHNGIRTIFSNSANDIIVNNNTINTTRGNTVLTRCLAEQPHILISKHDTVTLDGITTTIVNTSTGITNASNIAVLNRSITNPNTSRDIGARVYYFKVVDDDTIIADLIPVRVGQVGYMYDKVSKQLFGNAGTGDFILGPDINS